MSYIVRQMNCGASCKMAQARIATAVQHRAVHAHRGTHAGSTCRCRHTGRLQFTRRASRLSVVAAWGDDIEWQSAKVVKQTPAAEGFHTMHLDIGAAAAKKYTKPGQYLQVKAKGNKPGFYAIASSPAQSQDGTVELLLRRKGDIPEALIAVPEGGEVEASPVDGPGFRVERAGPDTAPQLFIFATGSGITPIKALIESGELQADKRKAVRLFWGTQNREMTPFKEEVEQWKAAGVQVVHVYSQDGRGYVQDVFEQENEIQSGASVGVILCGHKDMTEILTKQMTGAGVDKDKILMNFG